MRKTWSCSVVRLAPSLLDFIDKKQTNKLYYVVVVSMRCVEVLPFSVIYT